MKDPHHARTAPTRSDAMGPTSAVDPDLPGVIGTEEIHRNTEGFAYRDGEPEPEGRWYSGQGGITGKVKRQAPPK
jgi:hypothetical protein